MKSDNEKTLTQEYPNTSGRDLIAKKEKTKKVVHAYNNYLYSSKVKYREDIIKDIFGCIGSNFCIERPFSCDCGYNIYIGRNFYANVGCTFIDAARIEIGNNVMLGPKVEIYTTRNPDSQRAEPVIIGNDVWIGGNVTILPGVTIGDNALIASGSVVANDIPRNAFAAGNPAAVIKYVEEE